jgi:hypothetical protein
MFLDILRSHANLHYSCYLSFTLLCNLRDFGLQQRKTRTMTSICLPTSNSNSINQSVVEPFSMSPKANAALDTGRYLTRFGKHTIPTKPYAYIGASHLDVNIIFQARALYMELPVTHTASNTVSLCLLIVSNIAINTIVPFPRSLGSWNI